MYPLQTPEKAGMQFCKAEMFSDVKLQDYRSEAITAVNYFLR